MVRLLLLSALLFAPVLGESPDRALASAAEPGLVPAARRVRTLPAAQKPSKASSLSLAAGARKAHAEASEGSAHAAKMSELKKGVEKAMLALYMENAKARSEGLDEAGQPTAGPFGGLSAFGREDTAAELTEASIEESNKMIDQIEAAVTAETKRSMFRSLTRLRGVTISSFDGMANSQATNVDSFARSKQWTSTHKLDHLATQEGDVSTWAYAPDADLVQGRQRVVRRA